MKFLNFEAHVVVDGERLPEYSVEYDEKTRTAVCWVPSQAGKPFSVTGLPLGRSDINAVVNVYADGAFVGGKAYKKGQSWTSMTRSHASTSATTSRPLMFASIDLTDDDTLLHSANIKNLGEITVRLSRVEIISEDAPFVHNETSSLTNNQIHERSKKAVTHKINFTFKYRSIDVLRADGIAPPPSKSPGTDGGDDGEQDSDEVDKEEEQDKARLKALLASPLRFLLTYLAFQEQVNVLEAKMAKKGTKSKKKVKTEHLPAFIPGEVIDLTL
ncbi:hypothetical protein C0995_002417 [Termitomyces sp. Mi166|nr:hypothetical protein C0995_002417 [Termitomyces sp. Mi166\